MYNISQGFDYSDIKISDFLVGSLIKEKEEPKKASNADSDDVDYMNDSTDNDEYLDETSCYDDEHEEKDIDSGIFKVIDFSKLDSYDKGAEINTFIKDEISLCDNYTAIEQENEIENAFSLDKLEDFDKRFINDGFDTEGFSDEELSDMDRGKKIAEEMFAEKLKEADEIVKKAQEEADMIRQAAVFAAEKIKKDANTEGMANGYNNGYNDGMIRAHEEISKAVITEVEAIKAEVSKIINQVAAEKVSIFERYEDSLKNIALSTAEKIVNVSLESSCEVIKGMIESATADLKRTAWIKIYVSRYDFEMIQEADYDLVDSLSKLSDDIKIVVMENENIGTAIIETNEEVIDLSVSTQLNNIKELVDNAI